MPFDALSFLQDYSIQYWVEGKNTQEGWVQITCPFCNDSSNHGGFNLEKGYYNCWRCGFHTLTSIIQELTHDNPFGVIKEYSDYIPQNFQRKKPTKKRKLKMPGHPLEKIHRQYLIQRGFDPDKLIKEWSLLGTGPIGPYRFRIITPIYLNEQLISFQARDISNHSLHRYLACPIESEIIHYKHSLYGIDYVQNGNAIIVEGITDCWRLGYGAIAVFGVNYTMQQLSMMIERLSTVFILFDPGAGRQAEILARDLYGLRGSTIKVEIIDLEENDPAEIPQTEAEYLRKSLLNY